MRTCHDPITKSWPHLVASLSRTASPDASPVSNQKLMVPSPLQVADRWYMMVICKHVTVTRAWYVLEKHTEGGWGDIVRHKTDLE